MKKVLVLAILILGLLVMSVAARNDNCMGDCAAEQGICIGGCQGDGQCISRCAAAHGRCLAQCN